MHFERICKSACTRARSHSCAYTHMYACMQGHMQVHAHKKACTHAPHRTTLHRTALHRAAPRRTARIDTLQFCKDLQLDANAKNYVLKAEIPIIFKTVRAHGLLCPTRSIARSMSVAHADI